MTAEIARTPMATVHVDAPVGRSDRPALLAYCLDISRKPGVIVTAGKVKPRR